MGGGDHCSVGGCNNNRRYPEKNVKRSRVDVLQFHSIPASEAMSHKWEEGFKMGKNMKVCSNHFQDAKPTFANSYPTLFLNESGYSKNLLLKGEP